MELTQCHPLQGASEKDIVHSGLAYTMERSARVSDDAGNATGVILSCCFFSYVFRLEKLVQVDKISGTVFPPVTGVSGQRKEVDKENKDRKQDTHYRKEKRRADDMQEWLMKHQEERLKPNLRSRGCLTFHTSLNL